MQVVKRLVVMCGLVVLALRAGQYVLGDSNENADSLRERGTAGENNEALNRIRRSGYIETPITDPESQLAISRIDIPGSSRAKRGVVRATNQWGENIPYSIDKSYQDLGERRVQSLVRTFQKFSDSVCVNFVDVTNTMDWNDPNWLVKNGFKVNSFVNVKHGSGCSANVGYGKGASNFYPCYDPQINMHEIIHIPGGKHNLQMNMAKNYVIILEDNIVPSLRYAYDTPDQPMVELAFDGLSRMLYARGTWSRNNMESWASIRDDIFDGESSYSSELATFVELNIALNCTARFCPGPSPNCNHGYYLRYKGVCQCVCPPDYDPATNCATMINGPNTVVGWPQLPIALAGAGVNQPCPDGFQSGYVTVTGRRGLYSSPTGGLPVLETNRTLTNYPICTYDGSVNGKQDWNDWPQGGWFCTHKPKVPCGGAFMEYWLTLNSTEPVQVDGDVGDTVVDGNFVTMKYCCKNDEYYNIFLDLPNGQPFRLFSLAPPCPQIRGMRGYKQLIDFFVRGTTINGSLGPSLGILPTETQINTCLYLPLKYGCNKDVTFNSKIRSVNISTPDFGVARPSLTRCISVFRAPPGSRISVTFSVCDLDQDDKLLIKKYHKFQESLRIYCKNESFQILSEGPYLHVEVDTGYQAVNRMGVQYTAEVMLPEDMTYNAASRGDDYALDVAITEDNQDCLDWSECTECLRYPTKGMSGTWLLLAGNKCRNMEGDMYYPWCFTHRNGTNCMVKFCEVNGFQTIKDLHSDCPTLVRQDPKFCTDSLQHGMCLKSCNYQQPSMTRVKCGLPTIPSDGKQVSPVKTNYLQGERVYVNCTANPSLTQMEMLCTASGWTSLTTACNSCPLDWFHYGNRCIFMPKKKLGAREAETTCKNFGPSGTLFRVESQKDLVALRTYRKNSGGHHVKKAWISGELMSNKKWYFTSSEIQMAYFNWSKSYAKKTTNLARNCIKLEPEKSSNAGSWIPNRCDGRDLYYFACQLTAWSSACVDAISTPLCETLMAKFPQYCQHHSTLTDAAANCMASCGECATNPVCTAPRSSSYNSLNKTVNAGEVMTFACKDNLYLVSGNLTRACSSRGTLLGTAPVCRSTPLPTDVNINSIRKQTGSIPKNIAYLLTLNYTIVPFDGWVDRLYLYCVAVGNFTLFFSRQNSIGKYSLVDSLDVPCSYVNWEWTYKIPAPQQIAVLKGDIPGIFATSSVLSGTNCGDAIEKISNCPSMSASSFTEVQQSMDFDGTTCVITSFGYRVNPNKSA